MSSAAAQKIDAATYDEVPYESFSYPHTHPATMFCIASLFNMTPADIRTARVLELGCASGGNLFSQALLYPGASFTGIDLSAEQIALANKAKEWLGVTNVDFQQMDITKFDTKKYAESFDYIICHGVFSWVPDVVREKILALCAACLKPQGLALISYNTLPGWNAVRSLREMMLYHTNRFPAPKDKIAQAKALLNFLADNVPDARGSYKSVIEEERKMLNKTNDSYIFHDHLEHTNAQFYFHQFMEMAGKSGLTYVGDSHLSSMFVGNMPKGALEALQAVNDIVGQEQYMDFITNRRFRNSILCRAGVTPRRSLDEKKIFDYCLSPLMKPEEGKTAPPINFISPTGGTFTAKDDAAAALFLELCAAGNRPVPAEELVKRACRRAPAVKPEQIRATLQQAGIKLALHGYISLHAGESPAVTTVSAKPEVFKWARYQAAQPGARSVTNMLHVTVNSDMVGNTVMHMLDGTRTKDQVVADMIKVAQAGKITVREGDTPVTDEAGLRKHLDVVITNLLEKLAQQNLLVA